MNSPLVLCSPSLSDIWLIYKKVRVLKPLTIIDYEKKLRLVPELMAQQAERITKQMLLAEHTRLTEMHGLTTANYVIRIISALFEFSIQAIDSPDGKPLLIQNPARVISALRAHIKPVSMQQTRGIDPPALPQWLAGVLRHPQASIRDWLLFMLLTGSRRTEATNLTVADVGSGFAQLGGRIIPLSKVCYALVECRLRTNYGSPFVFPGKAKGQISNWNKTSLYVSKESGVTFTPYQLRLTYREIAISIGIPETHINVLMRGRELTISEPLRQSQQLITDEITRLCEPADLTAGRFIE